MRRGGVKKGGSKERGVIIRTVGHESSSKPAVQPLFRPCHCPVHNTYYCVMIVAADDGTRD